MNLEAARAAAAALLRSKLLDNSRPGNPPLLAEAKIVGGDFEVSGGVLAKTEKFKRFVMMMHIAQYCQVHLEEAAQAWGEITKNPSPLPRLIVADGVIKLDLS